MILTYYQPIDSISNCEELLTIDYFNSQWKNPVFCNIEDARKHPRFSEMSDYLKTLPEITPPGYRDQCFFRWLAFSSIIGDKNSSNITIVDYDVFPLRGFDSYHEKTKLINKPTIFGSRNPAAIFLPSGEFINNIVDMLFLKTKPSKTEHGFHVGDNNVFDQHWRSNVFWGFMEESCKDYSKAELIHFCNGCIPYGKKRSDVVGEWFDNNLGMFPIKKNGIWVLNGDTHWSKWIMESGRLDHDQWLMSKIIPKLNPGDFVIDGGCYIGDHTIAYSRKVNPGKVVGIDPNIYAIDCCKKNVPEALSICAFLSESDSEKACFFVEPSRNYAASRMVRGEGVCSLTIDTTVNRFLDGKCDFIKLDLEGYELNALKGSIRTLIECKPKMLIEINPGALSKQNCTPNDIFSMISKFGYKWERWGDNDELYDAFCYVANCDSKC